MGLGVSKAKPKYTPPKVCKKSATVQLLVWNFYQCPKTAQLTLRVTWPQEPFGLTQSQIGVYKLYRDSTDPCSWSNYQLHVGPFNANALVGIDESIPALTIAFEYTNFAADTVSYAATFYDYDSRKPKLLLPSPIQPIPFTASREIAFALLTI